MTKNKVIIKDLKELWIPSENNTSKYRSWLIVILVRLYKHILNKDENFHFIDEGTYLLLRYSPEYEYDIKHWFDSEKDINIRSSDVLFKGYWSEIHSVVSDHKDYFMRFFHATSVLALEIILGDGDTYGGEQYMERICHISYNILYFSNIVHTREVDLMLTMAKRRSFAEGFWACELESRKKTRGRKSHGE